MRRFGLIGKTLKHSFSKTYFTKKFTEEGIEDCSYENFELAVIDELPLLIGGQPELKGLNVTIPYKEEVLSYLGKKHPSVEAIGACNCIKIEDGILSGFNTDVTGFQSSLLPMLKPHHRRALILGTGGASKAVQYALQQLQIDFLLVSRRKTPDGLGYEDLGKDVLKGHQLIINTTPLGMYPHINDNPPVPYEHIGPQHLLYDLIYNPEMTKFLRKGAERGASIKNGYEMLVLQAEESWSIWNS